ncbi:putative F420-dependent oxidoreductase [Amycolatopsis endophytica]|uniref:Putative F420-dependent oxidoreductase n=1 Tax=Amycolatopsis endophytica TaxID=860233 RepID=A0A853B789_9PSEU|nr:LLM class flavin-dependent oxidoreductase [Amycolatopsis endophytica]NYI90850.1 putative F420-dependent oxidoreductase [Amycolatopsis endophytica]
MGMTELGPVGAFLPVSFTSVEPDVLRDAATRLERAGYHAAWTNEVPGKDALVQLAVLLGATSRIAFGTGIANIWAREPETAHAAADFLARAHPGRLVLGLGVGYPEQAAAAGREFGRPLATVRRYVDRMGEGPYPRILGANGPKMQALAGEIADGAFPAMLPPEGTAQVRRTLGPGKLLVAGLSVVPDRAAAAEQVAGAMNQPAFARAMAELGYAEGSDRLVDALVAHGDPAAVAARVRDHLAAGADHVALLPPAGADFAASLEHLEALAPAVLA